MYNVTKSVITWRDKIDEWKSGKILTYPSDINKRFFYETAICDKYAKNPYKERFIKSEQLEKIPSQDYKSFSKQLLKNTNKYVTAFPNLSGDTMLIIPVPIKGKNYTTIKDFIDNAPKTQQIEFWKKVANEIDEWLSTRENVYISTHGLGVYYFHLRLCEKPKYYITKKFT